MEDLENQTASFLQEYQQFYGELIKTAELEDFNEEQLNLSGSTFRKLVHEAVNLVVNHYYSLEEKCGEKWTYHR